MLEQFKQFKIQSPYLIYGGMKKADFIKSFNDDDSSDAP